MTSITLTQHRHYSRRAYQTTPHPYQHMTTTTDPVILVPAYQSISEPTARLLADATSCGFRVLEGRGCSNIALARNLLLERLSQLPHTPCYVWWIDSDIVASVTQLIEMQEELDAIDDAARTTGTGPTMLSARYVSRMVHGAPAWRALAPEERLSTGQILCDHVGLGCAVAYGYHVLQAWHAAPPLDPESGVSRAPCWDGPAGGEWYSEDRAYCRHWRQEIGGVVALSEQSVGHLMQVAAYPQPQPTQ